MMSVTLLLVLAAFIVVIAAALGRAPLWIAVMLLVLIELLHVAPIR